jgi:hypothetical protein
MSTDPKLSKGDEFPWMSKARGTIAPNPKVRQPDAPSPRPAARRGNYSNLDKLGTLDSDGCVNDTPLQEFQRFGSGLKGRGFVVEQPAPPRVKLFPLR